MNVVQLIRHFLGHRPMPGHVADYIEAAHRTADAADRVVDKVKSEKSALSELAREMKGRNGSRRRTVARK